MSSKPGCVFSGKDYAGTYAAASKALAEAKDWPAGSAWQSMREDLSLGFGMSAVESALRLGKQAEAEAIARTLGQRAGGAEQAWRPEG